MFARVTMTQISPERFLEEREKFINYIQEEVVPAARRQRGFKGGYWLASSGTGKGITVSFWESEEAEKASREAVAQIRQRAASDLSLSVTSVEAYEVLTHV